MPKSPTDGVRWADKAAAQRNAFGYYAIGYAYQHGSGEPVDPVKAWYNFAAAQRLDTKLHQFANVDEEMSLEATELTPAQIQDLQAEVAPIPQAKKADMVTVGGTLDSSTRK